MTNHPPIPYQSGPRPPRTRHRAGRYALAFLTVLACAASICLVVSLNKQAASAIDRHGGTRITLTARTPDGTPPAPETLSKAEHVIRKRVAGAGLNVTRIDASGDTLTVTVPGDHQTFAEDLGQGGQLNIRPVVHSLAAHPLPGAGRGSAGPIPGAQVGPALAQRLANEKKLRQSTSRSIQFLVMQFEAIRCDKPDILADNDDPDLPLITCSTDHTTVYLLGPSIIKGDQIREARSTFNRGFSSYGVALQFDDKATSTWAQFTAAHIGTQMATTLDTQVISAPEIREPILVGRAAVVGGQPALTADSARDLANNLKCGSLPIPFQTSKTEAIAPNSSSAGLWQSRRPIGLVFTALGVVVILVCLQVYLYRAANRWPQYPSRQ